MNRGYLYDVFLSYASADLACARDLAESLKTEGIRVWFDDWEIEPGNNFHVEINRGIEQSRKLISLWSENYFRDGKAWTRAEVFAKHNDDLEGREASVIPLVIRDCEPPPTLRLLSVIDYRSPGALQKLVAAIQKRQTKDDPVVHEVQEYRPRQHLRYRSRHFRGRENLLAELEECVQGIFSSGGGCLALRGPGGCGKSTLVAELAHRVEQGATRPFGGVLWTTFEHGENEDVSLIISEWLYEYGEDASDCSSSKRDANYVQLLKQHQPLVILDNVQLARQVDDLYLDDNTCFIVTTRDENNLPCDVDVIEIGELDERAALEVLHIFHKGVHGEPLAAKMICQSCDYLPLFLQVAGAILKAGLYDTLTEFERELRAGTLATLAEHDPRVNEVLELSWLTLKDDEREVLLACTLHPASDFGFTFVEQWLKQSIPCDHVRKHANRIVKRLLTASMVIELGATNQRDDRRFQIHNLISDYAAANNAGSIAESYIRVAQCLIDWTFVDSEFKQLGVEALATQFHHLLHPPEQDFVNLSRFYRSDIYVELQLWYEFFRKHLHTLKSDPELLYQQAINEPRTSRIARTATVLKPPASWLRREALGKHSCEVCRVEVLPDNRRVVSLDYDGEIRLWDVVSRECAKVWADEDFDTVLNDLRGDKHSSRVCKTRTDYNGMLIYGIVDGKRKAFFPGIFSGSACSDDGSYAVAGDDSGTVFLFRLQFSKES